MAPPDSPELPLALSPGKAPRRPAIRAEATRPPLARMLRLHELIRGGSFPNCHSLATELEVSPKTIQRDVDFMRDRMDLPLEYCPLRRGFHYTREVSAFPSLSMSEGEMIALLVAQKALEQYRGTAFEKPLQAAFSKMTSQLRDEGTFSFQELSRAISFRPVGYAIQELKVFETLSRALLEGRVVEFDYHKLRSQKSERRRIEPYHLGCIDNQWYLIGHDLVRSKLRTFALTRLARPRLLKKTFRRPPDFSLATMMSESFSAFETPKPSRVILRLDPFGARLAAERVWHPSQKLKPLPGGAAELTLLVGLAPDLENWILGWGSHALVLEPHPLRERIASIARSMALQYSA
jgi:predicted DNA-binding transcriptional regulator YafY